MVSALNAGSDVVLTLDTVSTGGFQGWKIERQVMGGSWQVWTASGWGVATPLLILATKFSDYAVSDGLYAYRVTPSVNSVFGTAQLTPYVIIGAGKVGWTFDNYSPPTGQWGELLTADDLRFTYLWGIVTQSSEGDFFVDAQMRTALKWAIATMERTLKLTITKKVIKCQPSASLVWGTDYDIEESGYSYRPDKWTRLGYITLKHRPVTSVEAIGFYSPVGSKMVDLSPWLILDKDKGVARLYPQVNGSGQIQQTIWALAGMSLAQGANFSYPNAFRVDYTAGYQDASRVPNDLRDIIGKLATVKLLNLIGDGLIAGFSSSSLSIDGLSESFSSTQSPENTYFGARISGYMKDIDAYIKENRTKFGFMTLGSI